jgi:hypothetical protein
MAWLWLMATHKSNRMRKPALFTKGIAYPLNAIFLCGIHQHHIEAAGLFDAAAQPVTGSGQ